MTSLRQLIADNATAVDEEGCAAAMAAMRWFHLGNDHPDVVQTLPFWHKDYQGPPVTAAPEAGGGRWWTDSVVPRPLVPPRPAGPLPAIGEGGRLYLADGGVLRPTDSAYPVYLALPAWLHGALERYARECSEEGYRDGHAHGYTSTKDTDDRADEAYAQGFQEGSNLPKAAPLSSDPPGRLTPATLVDLVGRLGREVYYLLDDCETSGPVGQEAHQVTAVGLAAVSAVLDEVDGLPYKDERYVLGTGAMLQAAMRAVMEDVDRAAYARGLAADTEIDELRIARDTYGYIGSVTDWVSYLVGLANDAQRGAS